ncbi:MAG: hypothetical protein WCC22_08675 [Terriglobales bacterium]
MSSGIPLPALQIQPPQPDLMGQMGKVMQLRNMQLENQQRQQQVNDQRAMTTAMQQWDPKTQDYDQLAHSVLQNGGSADAATKVHTHGLEVRQKALEIAKTDEENQTNHLKNLATRHDLLLGHLATVTDGPDEGIGDRLLAVTQQAQQDGLLDAPHVQQISQLAQLPAAQLRPALSVVKKNLQGEKAQFDEAMKERAAAAEEWKSGGLGQLINTRTGETKGTLRLPEGEIPLTPDQITQLNQLTLQRQQVLNPGAASVGPYQLQPGATSKDFDRIDKMLSQTESARATRAQQDTANAIRQQTLAIAQQGQADRQEKQGIKWVTYTDASGRTIAGPLSAAKVSGATDMAELPAQEVRDVQNARHAVRLMTKTGDPNKPETNGVLQLIDSLEKDGKLGILSSRFNSFMTKRVGASPDDDPRIITLIDKNMLSDTAAMLSHFGASGGRSPQMLQHFIDLANSGRMDAKTLKYGTLAIADYMTDRAMLPGGGAGSQQAGGGSASGKAVSLAAARQLPQNRGKSDDEIRQDIQAHGHQVID